MRDLIHSPLQIATSCLLCVLLSACAYAEDYRFTGVDRIVAVSDPHGAYDAFVRTLTAAEIIDAETDWAGEDAHLVITGDLLDRGPDSRKIMDLVMQLETQSLAAGGRVHLTLGNHEVMNLVGDLRYVSQDEYAAFAADETEDERNAWFNEFRAAATMVSGEVPAEAALRAEFDAKRPPGFFAHRRAFGSEGVYGRWLLEKPLVVVINDTAFVHGGLSPLVAELGLDDLNDVMRGQIADYVRNLEMLVRDGVIDPAVNFYEHGGVADERLLDPDTTPESRQALQEIIDLADASVHDMSGPLWYRGTVGCSVLSEGDVISSALGALGAERVVIGHTPTVTRRVLQRFDGRVIEIDTGMLHASYRGSGNALVIDRNGMHVVNERSQTDAAVVVQHPRRVGNRGDQLNVEALENILATGTVVSVATDSAERQIVSLTGEGESINAVFVPESRPRKVNTELAAYRLDRLLRLDMVPVTVAREVNGEAGTLQFLPENAADEASRSASGQGGGAWCPLARQWNSMYIFDVLVFNEGRAPHSMAYSRNNWQLMLVGHESAFATRRNKPGYLAEVPLDVTATWVEALQDLSDERLTESLGDVLDKRRLSALGKRRDLLLEEAVVTH